MYIPSTDTLCIFPVIQQVVGSATFLSNLVKAIYDIAKAVFTNTWKGGVELYEERDRALNTPHEEEVTQRILNLPGYQFEMHVMYMIVGIIRAIPFVGTSYSIGARDGQNRITQTLDDPRDGSVPFSITPNLVYV